MSITLAEIRLQARQRADMVENEFVEDSELNSYINNSLAELHDLLIEAYCEEYYMESVEFTSTGAVTYELPDGTNYAAAQKFYKLRGVDARINNDNWTTVKRFNFNRRNENDNFVMNLMGLPYLEYRIVGSNIRFNRIPDAGTEFRLWYYPKVVVLIDDADEFDDINGYAEYVIVDAVIKMLEKQEQDVANFMLQKEQLKKRIEGAAQNRDANEPESVSDIYAEDDYAWWGRGGGWW